MFDEFFHKAHELRSAGVPFATAVVVWADKPTSGKPGDRAIVTADGTMYGWIGGSCAQPTVVREAVRAIADGAARLVRLSQDADAGDADAEAHVGVHTGGHTGVHPRGAVNVPMTCFSGGTLEIFVEPHQPTPQLLVVGSLPVAQALAHLGKALSYRVVAVDPGGSEAMAHADVVLQSLADIAAHVTPLTFAVVATHGEYDEPALQALLETAAPYIALVASRKRGNEVLSLLSQEDVDRASQARVRFPAGLDIGAKRGDEIAVSIIAEIVQTRRSLGELQWEEPAQADARQLGSAIDPVCQMTVQIEGARHTYEYRGQTYYFCCPGCRGGFAANPEAYLAEAAEA